jgi:hypothetical protein
MSWKYEKDFRADNPQTMGEVDSHFDLDNYKDWLEKKLEAQQIREERMTKALLALSKLRGNYHRKTVKVSLEGLGISQ